MSAKHITVKRHNHRMHPCLPEKKAALLELITTRHAKSTILILTSGETKEIEEMMKDKNVTIMNDSALAEAQDLECDVIISYDLPQEPETYIARLPHAKKAAVLFADVEEQKRLYLTELKMGRVLMVDLIKGYEPEVNVPKEKWAKKVEEDRNSFANSINGNDRGGKGYKGKKPKNKRIVVKSINLPKKDEEESKKLL